MSIPVYRQNADNDDWEVASVYNSDDCDSLSRSEDDESSSSCSSYEPDFRSQGTLHDDIRRVEYLVPQPQLQPPQNYPSPPTYPRWDTRYVRGKGSNNFAVAPAPIVPPPGLIFPRQDWVHPPQDSYWHSRPSQIQSISDLPAEAGLDLVESSPPSLLLSPCSPPPASSLLPIARRPSPATTIAHGQAPHTLSTGLGPNISGYAPPITPPPPRYHETAHAMSPRLVEAGCQAHSNMTMGPPRRSGHDVLSPYAAAAGHASMPRRQSSEEVAVPDGRYGGSGAVGGHASHGSGSASGDRPDLVNAPPVPSKHEREQDGGCKRSARPQTRERRQSMWQRLVRRFSPSQVSIGQP